jgi:hypothetical protein
MTNYVPQLTPHDCAICCLAMLTDHSYERTLELVGDTFDSKRGMRMEQEALERLGFKGEYDNGNPVGDFVALYVGIMSPKFFRNMAWGRRALLSVPSLNFEGGWHMVYSNGHQLFGPSQMKQYMKFEDLLPSNMVVFREVCT